MSETPNHSDSDTAAHRSGDGAGSSSPYDAASGALAVALALATGELVAGLWAGLPSPIALIGGVVVRLSPPALTDFAINAFGTANVLVLQAGIVVVALLIGAAVGRLAARSFRAAVATLFLFGAAPLLAAAATPEFGFTDAFWPAAAAVGGGYGALRVLTPRAREAAAGVADTDGQSEAADGRRAFLIASAGVAALALTGGLGARLLRVGPSAPSDVAGGEATLPVPPDPIPRPPADTSLAVDGISPLVTPNTDFYVIDTALFSPYVDTEDWELRVGGLVERPFSLSYSELLDMATDEAYVMLACVSNEVGGGLAGTARWQGVRLDAILDRAGVRPEGTQVVGRSVDGFTVAFPTQLAMDGRDALVAVGMNGEPLPVDHGFPARLVVPGLYGYVSATKWLTEIELATDDFDAYWIPRGWARRGPIKIASRIDVPRANARIPAGRTAVAGVAWAPLAGIAGVEVRVDGGPWREARLADALNHATWRQWVYEWDPQELGIHTLEVRAIDADGTVQTAEQTPPRPDGATGHHVVTIEVA